MKKIFHIIIYLSFLKPVCGQTKINFVGNYLLNNGLDSVNLTIKKNGSFYKQGTSMCSGDDILYSKGKWKTKGDTLDLTIYSSNRTGQSKPTVYEWKPVAIYVFRHDTLFSIDNEKKISKKFFYYRIK